MTHTPTPPLPPPGPVRRLFEPLLASARAAPEKPAVAAGLRAAVATVVPVLVGYLLGWSDASWAGLAGFLVSRIDAGGAYRTRAAAMATLTPVLALSVAGAAVAGRHPEAAVLAVFAWTFAASLARAYGATAGSIGVSATVAFVVSLATPAAGGAEVLERGAQVLAAGAWAMLLSLGLWPIRLYRPAMLAVAACYRGLGDYAEALAGEEGGSAEFVRARQAVEAARAVLAAGRRGRPGESVRGERLLVLLETADRVLVNLLAMEDVLEAGGAEHGEREALAALAASLRDTAERVEAEGGEADGEPGDAGPLGVLAAPLVERLRELARAAGEMAAGLRDGRPVPDAPVAAVELPPEERDPLLPLRESLAPDSVLLRHALRVALVSAAAVVATGLLELQRGYWVTLTVVIVLQPYTGATVLRGVQRTLGTVLGGMLAALIAAGVHDERGIMAVVFALTVVSVSVLPINYGLYSVFLTPTFVLLAEVHAGDWHLAGVRIVNNLLGGALALAGTALLWPAPERDQLPAEVAAVLRADRDYLREAVARLADGGAGVTGAVVAARRRLGVAILNAEAWLEELATNPAGRTDQLQAWMTLLAYARRLAASVAVLGTLGARGALGRGEVAAFGAEAERVLDDLADAVEARRPPAPLPRAPLPPADPLLRAQLERVSAQLAVLHDAAARLGPPAAGELA